MVAQEIDARRLVFVDEMGTNTLRFLLCTLGLQEEKGPCAQCLPTAPRTPPHLARASMSVEGMGPCLAVRGSTTAMVFEAYVERVLCPTLKSGQQVEVVVVMNLLSAHKGERVRELIEERGCELLCASFSVRASLPAALLT